MGQIRKNLNKVGKPPGSIIYTGDEVLQPLKIELIKYNKKETDNIILESLNGLELEPDKIKWVNIYGLNNIQLVEEIGEKMSISKLVLEDIVHVGQRAKLQFFDKYMFLVLKMLSFNNKTMRIKQEQVSFILTKSNIVFTLQEYEGDIFDSVRKRISENEGNILNKGADYLLYCLIDAIVDQHFVLLSEIEEKIEELEEKIIENVKQETLQDIYKLRRELLVLKTAIWPLKDILGDLIIDENYISASTKNYLRDVNDHVIQIMDFIVIYREMITGVVDTHLSNVSNRMNQIMTTLTVFSAIFIPLTFIAGIYGMNFEYIPELSFKFGYFIFWVLCLLIAVGMFLFFKRKKWL